jgi:creatinine amidohydrolase
MVRYELMTPGEIVAERERCPVAYVPLGPMEWHGPHLPLGTDALVAHHLALRVAGLVGGLVLPALFAGTETVRLSGTGEGQLGALGFDGEQRIIGMDFPGNSVKSLYFEESTFGVTVRELLHLLKAEPYRLIVLVNFHGAANHKSTLERLAREETDEPRVRVILPTLGGRPRSPEIDPGHAEKWETAMVMALEESHVRLDALPPLEQPLPYPQYGIVNGQAFAGNPAPDYILPRVADPRYADRDEGIRLVDGAVRYIAEQVQRHLDEVQAAPWT